MNSLLQKLEAAVLGRNPSLAESLQPGLSEAKIRKDLKRGGIEGAIEPLIELYSWHDGTVLQGSSEAFKAGLRAGFAPPVVSQPSESHKAELQRICAMAGKPFDPDIKIYTSFHFLPLKTATVYMRSYKEYAQHHPKLSVLVGRYFPMVWNGSTGYVALDIDPTGHNRVVTIEKRDDKPPREAYDSFEDFLKDLIQANENNELLACIRSPKKHIEAPSSDASTTNTGASKKQIPKTENTLALRTDFTDETAWKSLCAALRDPDAEFGPNLDLVSDPKFDGLTADQLPSHLPEDSALTFVFIIDRIALSHPDHPILVLDLHDKTGRTFRVIPSEIGIVENNLSIANMDFDEFATAVDPEGIFRGFE